MTEAESAFLAYVRSLRLRREQEWARQMWCVFPSPFTTYMSPRGMSERRANEIRAEVNRLAGAVQGLVAS
jgi:hypothetical protein